VCVSAIQSQLLTYNTLTFTVKPSQTIKEAETLKRLTYRAGFLQSSENKTMHKRASVSEDGESAEVNLSPEPPRKKRCLTDDRENVEPPPATKISEHPKASKAFAGLPETSEVIVRNTSSVSDLPDPVTKVSPDVYLLQLLKAKFGVSVEVKPALQLESFFGCVTEEQMASYNMEVVGAVRDNNLELLKKLRGNGQALNCSNRFGESLLNMACRRGFESIVEYLLDQPDCSVRICDDGGRTPLHDACWNPLPQLNICKWILQRDPILFLISDRRGCTAFQYARPEHWNIWRQFLFENRECLEGLTKPDILSRLAQS
jgi:hypothetical protein